MKNSKRLLAAALAAVLALFSACGTLAEPEAGIESASEDRLVGVYVTWEHLNRFDFGAYIQDHGAQSGEITGDTSAYAGRLYAVEKPLENGGVEYVFEGVEGVSIFAYIYRYGEAETDSLLGFQNTGASELSGYLNSPAGAISVGNVPDLVQRTARGGLELTATLYVETPDGHASMYANPVYQDAQGRVYLTAAQGVSADVSYGSMSQWQAQTRLVTDADGTETEQSSYVSVTLQGVDAPVSTRLLYMDADNAVISAQALDLAAPPERLAPPAGAAYLVAETTHASGDVTRAFADTGAESLPLLFPRGGALWQKQELPLDWA